LKKTIPSPTRNAGEGIAAETEFFISGSDPADSGGSDRSDSDGSDPAGSDPAGSDGSAVRSDSGSGSDYSDWTLSCSSCGALLRFSAVLTAMILCAPVQKLFRFFLAIL